MLTECEWDRLLDEGTINDLYEVYLEYDMKGFAHLVPLDVLSRLDHAGYLIGEDENDD